MGNMGVREGLAFSLLRKSYSQELPFSSPKSSQELEGSLFKRRFSKWQALRLLVCSCGMPSHLASSRLLVSVRGVDDMVGHKRQSICPLLFPQTRREKHTHIQTLLYTHRPNRQPLQAPSSTFTSNQPDFYHPHYPRPCGHCCSSL